MKEEEKQKKAQSITDKEKFPPKYAPLNKNVLKNIEKYYISDKDFKCKELENNEIRRIFNYYDKDSSGFVKKSDIKFVFLDIKTALFNNSIELNEKLFTNSMLEFYAKCSELVDIKEIIKIFYNLIFDDKNNMINEDKKMKDIEYLKNLTLSETLSGSSSKNEREQKTTKREPGRNDIFVIRTFANYDKPVEIILNENKLEKAYK